MTPERIGKYQIVGKLGQGAMGEVFRGHDPVLNRDVAIKRISSGLDADESLRKRFEREAQAVALLNHPHIITVYELGFEGEQMFMAMELLEGIDLKYAMAHRKLGPTEKLATMEQICEGLAFAHARDLVHRDLKPANIHIMPGGKVKIMDFGLARTAGSDMTSTGTVMGTPHYMSPEQVKGMKADARSDVFALGCVFYELLSGHKPFDAESMHGVLFKVMQDEPTPLTELAPELPHALVEVVERALAKDPAERFQSAGEMLVGLRLVRAAGTGHPHERSETERPGTVTIPAAPAHPREPARTVTRLPARGPEKGGAHRPAPSHAPGHGRRYLAIGLVAGLVVVVGFAIWSLLARPDPQRVMADTMSASAQQRLDQGELRAAIRAAEIALTFDATHARAKAIHKEASRRLTEKAVQTLKDAQKQGGDVASPAFELMKIDPAHPEAEKAAQASGAAFRPRSEEAKGEADKARKAAVDAGATSLPAFTHAAALESQGKQALESNQFALAARRYLEARSGFESAARAARRP